MSLGASLLGTRPSTMKYHLVSLVVVLLVYNLPENALATEVCFPVDGCPQDIGNIAIGTLEYTLDIGTSSVYPRADESVIGWSITIRNSSNELQLNGSYCIYGEQYSDSEVCVFSNVTLYFHALERFSNQVGEIRTGFNSTNGNYDTELQIVYAPTGVYAVNGNRVEYNSTSTNLILVWRLYHENPRPSPILVKYMGEVVASTVAKKRYKLDVADLGIMGSESTTGYTLTIDDLTADISGNYTLIAGSYNDTVELVRLDPILSPSSTVTLTLSPSSSFTHVFTATGSSEDMVSSPTLVISTTPSAEGGNDDDVPVIPIAGSLGGALIIVVIVLITVIVIILCVFTNCSHVTSRKNPTRASNTGTYTSVNGSNTTCDTPDGANHIEMSEVTEQQNNLYIQMLSQPLAPPAPATPTAPPAPAVVPAVESTPVNTNDPHLEVLKGIHDELRKSNKINKRTADATETTAVFQPELVEGQRDMLALLETGLVSETDTPTLPRPPEPPRSLPTMTTSSVMTTPILSNTPVTSTTPTLGATSDSSIRSTTPIPSHNATPIPSSINVHSDDDDVISRGPLATDDTSGLPEVTSDADSVDKDHHNQLDLTNPVFNEEPTFEQFHSLVGVHLAGSWELFGGMVGLNPNDLQNIRSAEASNNETRLMKVLHVWKETYGEVTAYNWRSVINVLNKLRLHALAKSTHTSLL